MSLYDNLYERKRIIRCSNKIEHSKSKRRRNISRGFDEVTISSYFSKENKEKNLNNLLQALKDKSFTFKVLKGIPIEKLNSDKYRLITAPTVEDRIVHLALLDTINKIIYPYINTGVSYCGIKEDIFRNNPNGLNVQKAILKICDHLENKEFWVLKADIEKFFDKVPKDKLLERVESLLPDSTLSPLFRDIVYFQIGNISTLEKNDRLDIPPIDSPIGISQGSALSPLFANVYLADFDRAVTTKFGEIMIRYVDDILVFAKTEKEIIKIKSFIEESLKDIGLNLSEKPEKTYIRDIGKQGIEFLGLRIDRLSIREKNWGKMREELQTNILNMKWKEYKRLNTTSKKITAMNQKIHGLFNYYSYYHVEKLAENINKQILGQIKQHTKYNGLELIDSKKVSPIIPLPEWQNLFRKNT